MLIVQVVGAAIVRDQACLVAQRGPTMSLAGKWEFPGGKIEPGERPEQALAREIAEELGVEIAVGAHLGRGESRGAQRLVVLDVYLATLLSGEPRTTEHAAIRWSGIDDLPGLDWAEADIPILAPLIAHLRPLRTGTVRG